jgi:outer membrane protein assembly factor BamB
MKEKLIGLLLKGFLIFVALFVGVGIWYYTLGRKPKLTVSTKIATKAGAPTSHLIAPGEVLLLVGGKATLYDMAAGKEKWSADSGSSKSAPPPAVRATVAPAPALAKATAPGGKVPDQMLQARVERRMAKLQSWAAQLEAKRGNLSTPLKISNFKEEEAKYKAELAAAQTEAAGLTKSPGAATPTIGYAIESRDLELQAENTFGFERKEVFCSGPTIWIVRGQTIRMVDRANGRLIKEIGLPGKFQKVVQGPGCFYVAAAGEDASQQVTCIATVDGTAKTINISGAIAAPRFEWRGAGLPASPTTQPQRTEFSANGAELAQLDVRLVEKKISERQAVKGDSVSDWENADKNTTGGWASDAAVIAQAMSNDAQREMTGGKELVDESTYDVVLRRPFNPGVPDTAPIKVQGRPDVFSTTSFDLVVAGKTLIAFDHTNKKLWESKLAFPAPAPFFADDESAGGTAGAGTVSQPCLEDDKRLYFFDKGFLSAFDRNTGATLWRLPSVGIQKVQLDAGGILDHGPVLYVTSANGTAETLQYSQQATLPTLPVIFKVDAASGKILWKQEKYQDCFVSGGNVYATLETSNAQDFVNAVFDRSKAIQTRFKLYKLSARDGHAQWEWFQTRRPLRVEAENKKVSLLFSDELQVLTSRAL